MDRAEKYKRNTAIAMYDAGFSMLSIQKELGFDITVDCIRNWSRAKEENKQKHFNQVSARNKCEGLNCKKYAKKRFGGKDYCNHCYSVIKKTERINKRSKKKALHKARENNKCKNKKSPTEWKKRVFAGWKDTPEQAAIRRSPEYQEWRRIVLERDNYACQHCENTGGRLVVHHIKTFKMNPELRMEPDNGIVLCNKCHEELHLSRVKKPKILRLA